MCRSFRSIEWTIPKLSIAVFFSFLVLAGAITIFATSDIVMNRLKNPTPNMLLTKAYVMQIQVTQQSYQKGSGYCSLATATLQYLTNDTSFVTKTQQCYQSADSCSYQSNADDERNQLAYQKINQSCPLHTEINLYYADLYPDKCNFNNEVPLEWLNNSASTGYLIGSIFIFVIFGVIGIVFFLMSTGVCCIECKHHYGESCYKFWSCQCRKTKMPPSSEHEITSVEIQTPAQNDVR